MTLTSEEEAASARAEEEMTPDSTAEGSRSPESAFVEGAGWTGGGGGPELDEVTELPRSA